MVSVFRKNRRFLSALILAAIMSPTAGMSAGAGGEGGITLNATRIIYPQGNKQINVPIRNTSGKNVFLVQSWVEDAAGKKSKDFLTTPPLFTSNPKSENTLRLMYAGKDLPRDRETLYYFSAKGIPSVNKKELENQNALILATVTRIKLFVRPDGLHPSPAKAPEEIRFRKEGNKLRVINPTPYYITMTNIKAGNQKLKNTMLPPARDITLTLPSGSGSDITFSTINDYGAVTEPQKGIYL